MRRSRPRGFTILELAVVVAITGILAALALSIARAQARNVRLYQAVGELQQRAIGLRSTALSEGQQYLLVVLDAPNNDGSQCGWWNTAGCMSYFILYAPQPGFTLAAFDPAHPGAQASVSDVGYLPQGARFYKLPAYGAPPAPFDQVPVFAPSVSATCANGASCFAIRYLPNGTVGAVVPAGTVPPTGLAFVLASDAQVEGSGGDHRGVVVGFPTGIAKSWAY